MKKATFKYKKEDGSESSRNLINPSFIKESHNSYKDFEKKDVRYITGIEISNEIENDELRSRYEQVIGEYYSEAFQTLSEYIESKGLDPKKISQKTFKKEGVSDFNLQG